MNIINYVQKNWKTIAVVAAGIAGIVGLTGFVSGSVQIEGIIKNVSWTRRINIHQKRTVKKSGWSVPAGGRVTDTRWEYKGQKKVPSGVDKDGNTAYKEISEYATKYYYEIDEWPIVRHVVTNAYSDANGWILEPYWGQVELGENEKEGSRESEYEIHITERETGALKTVRVSESVFRQVKPTDYVRVKVGRLMPNKAIEVDVLD